MHVSCSKKYLHVFFCLYILYTDHPSPLLTNIFCIFFYIHSFILGINILRSDVALRMTISGKIYTYIIHYCFPDICQLNTNQSINHLSMPHWTKNFLLKAELEHYNNCVHAYEIKKES